MTEKRDYYDVLGVGREAGTDDIRKAYKQAALKYHPDRNPGDKSAEDKFKEATEAYGVLSDEEKRHRYDQFGHAGLEGMAGMDFNGADIFSQFQDLFSDFFGGFGPGGGQRRRSGGPQRGQDLRVSQKLSLKEAVLGCKREISIRAPVACEACNGSGAAPGSSHERCSSCRGSGQVTSAQGFVMFTTTCPTCKGQGTIIAKPCDSCRGGGQVEKSRKVLVTFPAGIDSGQRLRVPQQGAAGPRGGPSGDLFVDVDVASDEKFDRDGADLITRVHVSFADAALGTEISLSLLDGTDLKVDISPGTQPGDVISLQGKGIPHVNGRKRGTLHVVVQVEVPKRISVRAKALLQELETELGQPATPPHKQTDRK
ncbi:MAG: molecular chaperone DnaJ [Polyangiaceae bacterium]|nr:molecular chaperone DnaJ [Polyangiaceae bacterium]